MDKFNIDSYLSNLERLAAENIKRGEDDYIAEDGLIYCGKCKTPKQCRVEILGVVRTPMCLCQCAAAAKDAEDAKWKQQLKQNYIDDITDKAFPARNMRNWTFENDDGQNPRIISITKRYAENFGEMRKSGKGLLLFGLTGVGKTYSAVCIVNELLNQGITCLVTNFERIAATVQGMYEGKQEYLDSLNNPSLLVIDDLGVERKSEYMQGIVYNVIDSRCRSGLPMIVTTNLTADELKHATDMTCQRIYSRLFETCIPVEVKGTDRRRDALKKDYGELSKLLGLEG